MNQCFSSPTAPKNGANFLVDVRRRIHIRCHARRASGRLGYFRRARRKNVSNGQPRRSRLFSLSRRSANPSRWRSRHFPIVRAIMCAPSTSPALPCGVTGAWASLAIGAAARRKCPARSRYSRASAWRGSRRRRRRIDCTAPTTYAGAVSTALHSITSSALVLGDQRPRRLGSREFIVDACPEEIGFETDSFRNARNHVKQLR